MQPFGRGSIRDMSPLKSERDRKDGNQEAEDIDGSCGADVDRLECDGCTRRDRAVGGRGESRTNKGAIRAAPVATSWLGAGEVDRYPAVVGDVGGDVARQDCGVGVGRDMDRLSWIRAERDDGIVYGDFRAEG